MGWAIPVNELTLTDIKRFKQQCIQAGIDRALTLGIAGNQGELVVREAFPNTDFGQGAVGWATENYITAGGLAVGWVSAFDTGAVPVNAPTLPVGRVAVFYKFADTEANPAVTAVRFRVGGTGASTKGTLFLQLPIWSNLEPVVYFSEPVVYDPNDVIYIEVNTVAVTPAGGEHIPFGCFIIERVGAVIS